MGLALREDPVWWPNRACEGKDPNLFYADETDDARAVDAAKTICDGCPAKQSCLDHAIATREKHGIWGGLTERERDQLRRRRARRRAAERTPERMLIISR